MLLEYSMYVSKNEDDIETKRGYKNHESDVKSIQNDAYEQKD